MKYPMMQLQSDKCKRSTAVRVFFAFALWYYIYVYFFSFDQGVSSAPVLFYIPKYILWALVACYLIVVRPFPLRRIGPSAVLFAFYCLICAIHFVNFARYSSGENLINLMNLAFFSSMLILVSRSETNDFFQRLPNHVLLQVLMSVGLLFIFDIYLWLDRSIVGAFSNANSFGLALNVAIFWALSAVRPLTLKALALVAILAVGVLLTKSGSQTGVLFLGLAWLGVMQLPRQLGRIVILVIAAIFALVAAWNMGYLDKNMLMAVANAGIRALDALGIDIGIQASSASSYSVELRKEIHLFALDFVKTADTLDVLFGGVVGGEYLLFDSQYLMFFINYGLIGLFAFIAVLILLLFVAFEQGLRTQDWFSFTALMAFIVTFLFSRVLYYFPINMIFFLLVLRLNTYSSDRKTESVRVG